jgi:hypothetical protein
MLSLRNAMPRGSDKNNPTTIKASANFFGRFYFYNLIKKKFKLKKKSKQHKLT